MASLVGWIFKRDGDQKHTRYPHALFSLLACLVLVLAASIAVADRIESPRASAEAPRMGYFLLAYIAAVMVVRLPSGGGPIVVYEMLWGCNVALVLAGVGMVTGRPLLVAAAMISISIDQVMWYVDLGGFLVTGKCPIGVAKYLFWPETPLIKKVTCGHHVWFLPVCLWALCRTGGGGAFPPWSFALSEVVLLVEAVVSRALVPFEIVFRTADADEDRKRGRKGSPPPASAPAVDEVVYMNINLTHECWKDVTILPLLHVADHTHWAPSFAWLMIVWGTLNLPCFGLLALILRVVC